LREGIGIDECRTSIEAFEAEYRTDPAGDDHPDEGAYDERGADPHMVGGGQPAADGDQWGGDDRRSSLAC